VAGVSSPRLSGVKAVAAGGNFALALKTSGEVVAWGDDTYHQTEVPAAAKSGVTFIAAGSNAAFAIKSSSDRVETASGAAPGSSSSAAGGSPGKSSGGDFAWMALVAAPYQIGQEVGSEAGDGSDGDAPLQGRGVAQLLGGVLDFAVGT